MTQLIMIDQFLVAERDADHTQQQERAHVVLNVIRVAPIGETDDEALSQPDRPIDRAEQQRASIRGNPATVETGDYDAAGIPLQIQTFPRYSLSAPGHSSAS